MTFQENGLINDDLWKSTEWENFYNNNLNIHASIQQVFMDHAHFNKKVRLTTNIIAETLDKKPKFIHLLLAIWRRHYCTFYKKYGRVEYIDTDCVWEYMVIDSEVKLNIQ